MYRNLGGAIKIFNHYAFLNDTLSRSGHYRNLFIYKLISHHSRRLIQTVNIRVLLCNTFHE